MPARWPKPWPCATYTRKNRTSALYYSHRCARHRFILQSKQTSTTVASSTIELNFKPTSTVHNKGKNVVVPSLKPPPAVESTSKP